MHTIAGPNRGFRFDTETNLPTMPAPDEEQVPVVDIPSGKDNNVAVYAEDRFRFNDHKTDVFAGTARRPQRLAREPDGVSCRAPASSTPCRRA